MSFFKDVKNFFETITSSSKRHEFLYQQALQLLKTGKAQEAEPILQEILEDKEPKIEHKKAYVHCLLLQKRGKEARQFIAKDTENSFSYEFEILAVYGLSKKYFSSKAFVRWLNLPVSWGERKIAFEKIRKKFPRWSGICRQIAEESLKQKDFDFFIESLDHLRGNDPPLEEKKLLQYFHWKELWKQEKNPEIRVFLKNDFPKQAETWKLMQLLQKYPDFALLHFELGKSYFEKQEYRKAIASFRLATGNYPYFFNAWLYLYLSALHLEHFEMAYDALLCFPTHPFWREESKEKLQKMFQRFPFLHFLEEGMNKLHLGDHSGASSSFEQGLKLEPQSPHFSYLLSKSYHGCGKYEQAFFLLHRLLRQNDFPEQEKTLLKKCRLNLALAQIQHLEKKGVLVPIPLFENVDFADNAEWSFGKKLWKECLDGKISPKVLHGFWKASPCFQESLWERIVLLEKALLFGFHSEVVLELAWLYFQTEWKEKQDHWIQLLEKSSLQNIRIQFHLGSFYWLKENTMKALHHWNHVIQVEKSDPFVDFKEKAQRNIESLSARNKQLVLIQLIRYHFVLKE